MKREKNPHRLCSNEGCSRAAASDRPYCDTCDLEWALYRRDLRAPAPAPSPRP